LRRRRRRSASSSRRRGGRFRGRERIFRLEGVHIQELIQELLKDNMAQKRFITADRSSIHMLTYYASVFSVSEA
jgi:hypothetical protein